MGEYAREHALTGFGWGALGYSQIAASPLAGFAPVGGIHLVTLATAWLAALWVALLLADTTRPRLAALATTVLLLVAGYGLKQHAFTTQTAPAPAWP